jgi:cell division protease FtsH
MSDPNQGRPSPMGFFRKGQSRAIWWYAAAAIILIIGVNSLLTPRSSEISVDFSTFKGMIQSGEIKRVEMNAAFYLGYTVTQAKSLDNGADAEPVYRTTPVVDPNFVSLLDAKGVQYYAVLPVQRPFLGLLLSWVVPLGLMFLVWRVISRRMGSMGRNVMSFGQNKSRIVAERPLQRRRRSGRGQGRARGGG